MQITTPLNQLVILSLTPVEARMVATALGHTRREYFALSERGSLAAISHGLEACLVDVVQIRRHPTAALA